MALRGEIAGMVIAFRVNGRDQFAATGEFKKDKSACLGAIARANWKLNLALDSDEDAQA
jgi:hypothetical protein